MTVFVSSTCYDLIDLRAELEEFFRDLGVSVILSDSPTSDFQVDHDKSSIETCLVNVRKCDQFIIILSSRYGPTLEKAGYGAISATHLEYRHAKEAGKPIHMYVRDRLESDYAIWKHNKNAKPVLSWCKNPHDHKIFGLLEEHRTLSSAANASNWVWFFQNSTDLKKRVAHDFRTDFAQITVAKLAEAGRLPVWEIIGRIVEINRQFVTFRLQLQNFGSAPALSPAFDFVGTQNRYPLGGIRLGFREFCGPPRGDFHSKP